MVEVSAEALASALHKVRPARAGRTSLAHRAQWSQDVSIVADSLPEDVRESFLILAGFPQRCDGSGMESKGGAGPVCRSCGRKFEKARKTDSTHFRMPTHNVPEKRWLDR